MNLIDKKKLWEVLEAKLSNNDIDEVSNEILRKVNELKKRKKNKKRREQLDLLAKKYDLNILSNEQIIKIPKWIKKDLKSCKVVSNSKKVILTKNGQKYHLDNKLNDLAGNEWSYFLRSVINTRYLTSGEEGYAHHIRKIHPSPKPPQLMRDIIKFFTKENEYILDYFMGVGGTLLGASLSSRNALGIDLSSKFISAYKKANKELKLKEQTTIKGDCIEILKNKRYIEDYLNNKKFSLIALDPPYGDMMNREKTGETIKKGQSKDATPFTKNKKDLGNMNWLEFREKFIETIKYSMPYLKDKGHYVVFIKDLQPKKGKTNLLHSDLIEEINKIECLNYIGMKIWADESINLYPYGYPHSFVSNQIHQYIMFFRKKS
ncbi:MAG: RNA methyltransferase [Betaproteobacteria bacterium TMED82]|nr:MAG: RNA methyltransferase [Betaproteobacteria bacterium TMED82]